MLPHTTDISQHVEQLLLAGKFLGEHTNQHKRLALILIDNVVELLVHEYVAMTLWSGEAEALPKNVKDLAQSQYFKDKLKALKHMDLIDNEQYQYAMTAHRIRGDLFHVGDLHQAPADIIAWQYYTHACEMLNALSARSANFDPKKMDENSSLDAAILYRVTQHSDEYTPGKLDVFRRALTKNLIKCKPYTSRYTVLTLQDCLALTVKQKIDQIRSDIGTISSDHPQTISIDHVIHKAEYIASTLTQHSILISEDSQDEQELLERAQQVTVFKRGIHAYVPKYREIDIINAEKYYRVILHEKSPACALSVYYKMAPSLYAIGRILYTMVFILDLDKWSLEVDLDS